MVKVGLAGEVVGGWWGLITRVTPGASDGNPGGVGGNGGAVLHDLPITRIKSPSSSALVLPGPLVSAALLPRCSKPSLRGFIPMQSPRKQGQRIAVPAF